MENRKIHSSDRCPHCNHWFGEDEQPVVVYSEARAEWLEEAAEQMEDLQGDDDWVDWMAEGKRLSSIGE